MGSGIAGERQLREYVRERMPVMSVNEERILEGHQRILNKTLAPKLHSIQTPDPIQYACSHWAK